ncbi:hypothetical protein RYX36_018255 [Vicia faba]
MKDKFERRGRARFNKLVEFIEKINVFSYMVLFDIVLRIRAHYRNSQYLNFVLKYIRKRIRSSQVNLDSVRHQEEKQKLRFHYGLPERQLQKYVRVAGKAKGSIGQVLLQLLEMRLDNILFRLGMAVTIPQVHQLVNHIHVLVNGRIVKIPSYHCKPEDIITAKDEQKSRTLIQSSLQSAPREKLPTHLTLDPSQYKGLVNQIIDSQWVGLKIKELLVV